MMGARLLFAATVFGIAGAALAPPLLAHHSAAAYYDITKSVTLTGRIARVDWRNPHVFFYIDAKSPSGAIVTWTLETQSPIALDERSRASQRGRAGGRCRHRRDHAGAALAEPRPHPGPEIQGARLRGHGEHRPHAEAAVADAVLARGARIRTQTPWIGEADFAYHLRGGPMKLIQPYRAAAALAAVAVGVSLGGPNRASRTAASKYLGPRGWRPRGPAGPAQLLHDCRRRREHRGADRFRRPDCRGCRVRRRRRTASWPPSRSVQRTHSICDRHERGSGSRRRQRATGQGRRNALQHGEQRAARRDDQRRRGDDHLDRKRAASHERVARRRCRPRRCRPSRFSRSARRCTSTGRASKSSVSRLRTRTATAWCSSVAPMSWWPVKCST